MRTAQIWHYCQFIQERGYGEFCPDASGYAKLHAWSVEKIEEFWRSVWDYCGVVGVSGRRSVQVSEEFRHWRFFPDGKLNFAENLIRPDLFNDASFASSDAIVSYDEAGFVRRLSRKQLYEEVLQLATHLRRLGVSPGDCVAAVLPNRVEAVLGLLATSLIGAVWTSCATEYGDEAILQRFEQVRPVVVLLAGTVTYKGRVHHVADRVRRLLGSLPSVRGVVLCGGSITTVQTDWEETLWSDIQQTEPEPIEVSRFPFNHPLTVLYSSGTTGAPKCILHSSGGTLLQHMKEHQLHSDIRPNDRVLYYTTTGWMMWNWLVSALASRACVVLYDGSPLYPRPSVLWEIADETQLTHLGASPRYFAGIEQSGFVPSRISSFPTLRCLFSTGSPLLENQFHWIYEHVKRDVCLASISGGTDLVSLFLLGNPAMPVHAGEMQVKGLGMDVQVFDDAGRRVVDEYGELVCRQPFPCMPLCFLNDVDGKKYESAYFDVYPQVWRHGDWALEKRGGGWVISGRSDAVLNPNGVRIGTAEIYQQLEVYAEIEEGLATVLRNHGDEEIILFLKLRGTEVLTQALVDAVKARLRKECSPRHVPRIIVQAPDLPRTVSGKLSEIAVRNILCGKKTGNAGALANPESLAFFRSWADRMVSRAE